MKYGLPILCPVDERGVLTDEAGEFSGTFYQNCDTVVVDRLVRRLDELTSRRATLGGLLGAGLGVVLAGRGAN